MTSPEPAMIKLFKLSLAVFVFVVGMIFLYIKLHQITPGYNANGVNEQSAQELQDELAQNIITSYSSLAKQHERFSNLSNAQAIHDGIVPNRMLCSAGSICGPWAGSLVTLAPYNEGQGFSMTWDGIPSVATSTFGASQKRASKVMQADTSTTFIYLP